MPITPYTVSAPPLPVASGTLCSAKPTMPLFSSTVSEGPAALPFAMGCRNTSDAPRRCRSICAYRIGGAAAAAISSVRLMPLLRLGVLRTPISAGGVLAFCVELCEQLWERLLVLWIGVRLGAVQRCFKVPKDGASDAKLPGTHRLYSVAELIWAIRSCSLRALLEGAPGGRFAVESSCYTPYNKSLDSVPAISIPMRQQP